MIVFSSMIGGTLNDSISDIEWGVDGNIYFVGFTSSNDILTTGL